MRAVAVALLLEEQRGEILAAWRQDVERELGGEPALAFAVGPLLREMALSLRGDASPFHPGAGGAAGGEPAARFAVLLRSGAAPARIAREFKLVHRAIWQTLKTAGAIVGADERRAGDEWLDEALAAALDRQDRVRTRADLFEGLPARAPARAPHAPAEAPRAAPPARLTPPPLPRAAPAAPPPRAPSPPVIAARPPPLPRPTTRPTAVPAVEPAPFGVE